MVFLEESLGPLPDYVLEDLQRFDLASGQPWLITLPPISDEALFDIPPSDRFVAASQKPEELLVAETVPITLRQALNRAKVTNREIVRGGIDIDSANTDLALSRQDLYPQLFLDLIGGAGYEEDFFRNTDNIEAISRNIELLGTVRYEILDNQRNPRIQQAEIQLDQSELGLRQTLINIPADVSILYYNLQEANAFVSIALQAVARDLGLVQDSLQRQAQGRGSNLEVERARASLQENYQRLLRDLRDQQAARFELAEILSLYPTVLAVPAEPVDQVIEQWPSTLEETLIMAYRYRTDLRILEADRQRLDARLAEVQNRNDPVLSVVAQGAVGPGDTTLNSGGSSSTVERAGDYFVGLNLDWTLYDNNRIALDTSLVEQDLDRNILELANLQEAIRRDVADAYYNVLANQASIESAELLVNLRSDRVQQLTQQFQEGEDVQDELFREIDDLRDAQINLIERILGFNRGVANLYRQIGSSPWLNYDNFEDNPLDGFDIPRMES